MPGATQKGMSRPRHDDIDNYDVGELSDDPFGSPSPDTQSKKKKRKAPGDGGGDDHDEAGGSGLGIDEAVSVAKRAARAPNVKLDEDRLLSAAGIPRLRTRASGLRLKGKGHEFGDAARLLSFYQLWLDDLYPKARFLDALRMVEKAGHKKKLALARVAWINEGKVREDSSDAPLVVDDESGEQRGDAQTAMTGASAAPPPPVARSSQRASTPTAGNDVPDDEDLYGATPRRHQRVVPVIDPSEPDPDDLAALMAEADDQAQPRRKSSSRVESGDELDDLIAEAENHDTTHTTQERMRNDTSHQPNPLHGEDNFAAEEAAMEEMDGLW